LRRAREEAATAVLAHAELKEQFETRLQLEAGEAYSQIVHLEELVVDLRSRAERAGIELEQLRAQVGTEREAITDREEEIARLSDMLGKRDRRVEWLEAELAAAGNSVEQANAARFDSEQQLVDALRRVELLSGRVDSLDSALQASVQRNAEQEEALLHWQELAAATKARIAGLEERVAKYRERISETERELRVLRKRTTEKQDEEPSVGAIAGRGQERTITDERSGKTAGAERKIGLLEEELTAAKTAARERDEQLLWFKTSLAASENQRRSALEKWAEQERTVLRLRKSLAAERELVEQWKTRVGRLSELLYASERQVRPPAEEEHADVRSGGETKPDRMRAYEARIHVLETEIEQHREAFTVQAKRLAESRAALAETLVALNRARARLDEQSGTLVAPETHVANEVPDEGREP
jgi:chromosome segregation ATPase